MVNRTFRIYDVETVKADLVAHLYTRRGSRLMMPTFGTILPDIIGEQMDEYSIEQIREAVEFVIAYDPRVQLVDGTLRVEPLYDQNAVAVSATLTYIELDYVDVFDLNIEWNN